MNGGEYHVICSSESWKTYNPHQPCRAFNHTTMTTMHGDGWMDGWMDGWVSYGKVEYHHVVVDAFITNKRFIQTRICPSMTQTYQLWWVWLLMHWMIVNCHIVTLKKKMMMMMMIQVITWTCRCCKPLDRMVMKFIHGHRVLYNILYYRSLLEQGRILNLNQITCISQLKLDSYLDNSNLHCIILKSTSVDRYDKTRCSRVMQQWHTPLALSWDSPVLATQVLTGM